MIQVYMVGFSWVLCEGENYGWNMNDVSERCLGASSFGYH